MIGCERTGCVGKRGAVSSGKWKLWDMNEVMVRKSVL